MPTTKQYQQTVLHIECLYFSIDFDGDDLISDEDLKTVIECLTGVNKLKEEEMTQLVDNVSCFFLINVIYLSVILVVTVW